LGSRAYYLTPDQLSAETGQGLVVLAERTTASRGRLLSEAVEILGSAVAAMAAQSCWRRAAVSAIGAAACHLPGPGLPAAW